MQTSKLYHPVLNVTIGGDVAEKRLLSFCLTTDECYPNNIALLEYPSGALNSKEGDSVIIQLSVNGETHLIFTGEIDSKTEYRGIEWLTLQDGCSKLYGTAINTAYRKENAKVILQDILEKSGITKKAVTCPDVELARFSTGGTRASRCITLLIKALEEHGHTGLRFFFDETDTFHFGTLNDTGKNNGSVFEFEMAKNILNKGDGWIEVLPLPIRHSQSAVIDRSNFIIQRTELRISGSTSRLRLYYEGRV